MNKTSRAALGGAVSALVAAGVVALPVSAASAVSGDVVVSEVYGGGGNTGATYTNDFVELYNAGSALVDVTGWSVQYASSSGTSWQRSSLTGSIAPGAHYLVQEGKGNGGTTTLPTPDATGTIAMSGSKGKVALVTDDTALSCGADCHQTSTVKDFVGYGDANDFEGSGPAPTLANETSDSRRGADTDDNYADFVAGDPSPVSSSGGSEEPPPPTGIEGLQIHDVQGASQLSPYAGSTVLDVPGIVTAASKTGFWMQPPTPDDDPATSEGVFVFTRGAGPAVGSGDSVTVTGDVQEYRGGSDGLTVTELSKPAVTVVSSGATLPAPTLVGPGGRVPPASVIEDDATGSVEQQSDFDPATDGIDFWESMEGMRVEIDQAQVVGPTSGYGELPVVPLGSGTRTTRGGIAVTADDFNPERVLLDDVLAPTPSADTGDTLAGTTVGVLDYSFSNFKLLPSESSTVVSGGLTRETTTDDHGSQLSIASFNVENLDPTDPRSKFDGLAAEIVANLSSPDILGIEEVQDNDGATNSGTTAADETLRLLTEAIVRAGGPAYQWRQIDPVDGREGGEPGGNIRVAFLFKPGSSLRFVDRGTPSSTVGTDVYTAGKHVRLTRSPGRIDPANPAWENSRVPLVGEFSWRGKPLFVVANHFASKGGDDPLFGRWQPPVRSSETKRHEQSRAVRGFVDKLLAADSGARVAVLGDLNDYEFSQTADILVGGSGATALTDLPRTLPLPERYTYVFEGNSQVLDHILLSQSLVQQRYAYDVVHVNAEFAGQISDHDPQVVRIGR